MVYIHRNNGYWALSKCERVDGKPRRKLIASLGRTDRTAKQKIEKMFKEGRLSQAEYQRIETQFDTDVWGTPQWVISLALTVMGSIDLDPCTLPENPTGASRYYTKIEDGLTQPWLGNVWLNPPYSKPLPWLQKLVAHHQRGDVLQAISLVKSGVLQNKGTGPLVHSTATTFGLWNGRLRFEALRSTATQSSPDFDVAVIYWGLYPNRFKAAFKDHVFLMN